MEEAKGELKESLSEKEIEKRKDSLRKKLFSWVEDNYDKVFICILIISFVIELFIFARTMSQSLWYDEASYMATAQRMGLGLHVNDIWYYRRGFLWPLFSAAFYFLNIGEIGVRFMVVLFSVGISAGSYFLIKEMFNKKMALLVSAALSLSWIILFFTGRVLTDIPSTFFLILSVFFFWKGYVSKKGNKYLYLFGLFFGLAIMTRMQNLMFIPAFLIFIFSKEKFKFVKNKHLWITLGIIALVLIPQAILYSLHYGNPLTDILAHYGGISNGTITPPGTMTISKLLEYFIDMPYILGGQTVYGKIIFILFLLGIFYFFLDMIIGFDKIFRDSEIQKRFFMFIWIVIPLLVLGYISDYPEERYVTPMLTFLFFIALYPLQKAQKFLVKKFKMSEKSSYILVFFIIILLLIPNLIWGFQLADLKNSYDPIKEAGLWLKQNSNPGDIIISPSQPQMAYYAQRSAYTEGFNETDLKKEINELKPRYLVISIYEPASLPWLLNFTQQNNNTVIPVQAYPPNTQQATLIIYEINYPK